MKTIIRCSSDPGAPMSPYSTMEMRIKMLSRGNRNARRTFYQREMDAIVEVSEEVSKKWVTSPRKLQRLVLSVLH